jgi:hypothetical protein
MTNAIRRPLAAPLVVVGMMLAVAVSLAATGQEDDAEGAPGGQPPAAVAPAAAPPATWAPEPPWPVPVPGWAPLGPGEHPRLVFRASDLPALRARAQTPEGREILRLTRENLAKPFTT